MPTSIELELGRNKTTLQQTDSENPDITIFEVNTPTEDNIRKLATEVLTRKFWWLDPELHGENGELREKLILSIGNHEINIYNFWQTTTLEQREEIRAAFLNFYRYFPDAVLSLEDVILNGKQVANEKSGEHKNGRRGSHDPDKILELFPAAFEGRPSTISSATTHLTHTITHELAHSIKANVIEEWRKKFGWRITFDAPEQRILSGGFRSIEVCDQPESCITDYARSDASEDICESFVAYIYEPDKLNEGKREFLKGAFPFQNAPLPENTISTLPDERKVLPTLPPTLIYAIKTPRARVLKN